MVVECDAVETKYMVEKYTPGKGCNKIRVHFYFLVEVVLLLRRAAAAAHNISAEAERSIIFSLLVAVLLLLFLIERNVLKEIRLVSAFCLIGVRNQSRSV